MRPRPLLLLDIDGVVCPMGVGYGEALVEVQGRDYPISFSVGTPRRLRELAQVFTLVWASSWEAEANRLLAAALSIPPLPFVMFSRTPSGQGQSDKLRAVKHFVKSHALAWLDDEVGDDIVAWAARRRVPTLIRPVDPRVGLSDEDVSALLQFGELAQGVVQGRTRGSNA